MFRPGDIIRCIADTYNVEIGRELTVTEVLEVEPPATFAMIRVVETSIVQYSQRFELVGGQVPNPLYLELFE